MHTAVIVGGTGLVGSCLVLQLLQDERFAKVTALGRRKTGRVHPKLEEWIVDFESPESFAPHVSGDVAFSCLGTTRAQAGGEAAQKKVDYDYQLAFARIARAQGIGTYALVSAASANPRSRLFYNRIKGELDRDVQALGFERVRILRPSLLGGERRETRRGESLSRALLGAANALGIARRYREIPGEIVAKAMISAALDPRPGTRILTLDELFEAT